MSVAQCEITKVDRALQRRKLVWRWLFVVGYAGGIFVLSSLPGQNLPSLHVHDKVLHAVEFGCFTILVCRAIGQTISRTRFLVVALSVLLVILYGASDEIHQVFVAMRMADVADVAADSLGAVLAGWGWLKASARWPWLR